MEEVKGNTEMKLNRSFYTCGVLEASEKLLGKILVHRTKEGITKGRIVELEAYNGAIDKAAHSYPNRRYNLEKAAMPIFILYTECTIA